METEVLNKKTATEEIRSKLLAPKLRFDGFKDEWRKKRLGEIASITTGNTPSTTVAEFYNGSKLFVSPADLNNGRYVYKTKTTLTESGFNEGRKISKGSVLFVCIGSTIGKVGQATEECLTNQQINSLEALKDFDNNFIYGLLEKNGKKIKLLAGVQAVPQINKTDFSNFKYHIPTLPEQQKIASFLSAIDEKIQQLTRKKKLLEQYKKGLMQLLFSGKLRFKDENGKTFPEWEEKRLGDVGDIVSGLTYSPLDIHNDGILVLRSSNVQDRRLSFEDNVYVKVNAGGFNPIKENDILICVRNGSKNLIGKNAIIDKKNEGVAFGAFMTVYRSDFNLFLFHYFDTDDYKDEVHKNLGATINSINGSDLKKFKIPFPCKAEQKKIADYLSNIDNKIESVNKQITQTQSFKKGLLQQMFV